MKTKSRKKTSRFQLVVSPYGNFYYIERIRKLEAVLARKPRSVQIDLLGIGEIPADSALLLRSVLMARSPKTRIVTNARSSLQGASVLVWLLGDRRMIRLCPNGSKAAGRRAFTRWRPARLCPCSGRPPRT